jgi:hypothetical protein
MNHSLYQDGILKALPFKRLPCIPQGNRVKKSCGNKACQEIVVPGGDFAPKA